MSRDLDLQTMLATLRQERPLTQCITNFVAMNICANVLLAVGASPAMVHSQAESAEFSAIARALTINIGTLSPEWVEGMTRAIDSANAQEKPWVFDPVAHFATPYRRDITSRLLNLHPSVLRGNASEIIALSGKQAYGSGADSGDDVITAIDTAIDLAEHHNCVVAVTGERDFVTNGKKHAFIDGGSPIMPKVTALGCSLTGLIGAFHAIDEDAFHSSIAALALFAVCGERAAAQAVGPGSFEKAFLDQLFLITPEEFAQSARIEFA